MIQLTPNLFSVLKKRHTLLLFILLVGLALRLYRLGVDSLWYDETVSAFLAAEPVSDLIDHTARDIHPPGYYLLLHFWTVAAGHSEFALAFFSLIWGVLLIPLTYGLARRLVDTPTAVWSALLVALSPYHAWYSQEVRMYTLGAALGLVTVYCFWEVIFAHPPSKKISLFWLGYVLSATLGLYILYYFAFLLLTVNILLPMFLPFFIRRGKPPEVNSFSARNNFPIFSANFLILIAYIPWLPTAWRQITYPPVPSWRTFDSLALWPALLESWSALSLGQSVEPQNVWPILLLTLVLFVLGLLYLLRPSAPSLLRSPALFLLACTFGPFLLIYLFSFLTPLYHVRYLFTYSPAFYVILAAGFVWLMRRRWVWIGVAAAGLFFAAGLFSLYQYHFDPRYRPDDYRAAVDFIQRHWQPGDVMMVNAGYVYPVFFYYSAWPDLQRRRLVPYQPPAGLPQPLLLQTGVVDGSPQLGWGDPRSDFYAMSAPDTLTALEAVSKDFSRLWLLRAYDTVTDPTGLIRAWLAEHTIPLEDEPFSGESNIRAQGFLLTGASTAPQVKNFRRDEAIRFEDGMALAGWSLPSQTWRAGQIIRIKLWWFVTRPPGVDYKMSLKLWTPAAELAAQGQDAWPVGRLYRATAWPVNQIVYQGASLVLPPDLSPGQYWLNVELYHPETGLPLPRLDEADPVVPLGPVGVGD